MKSFKYMAISLLVAFLGLATTSSVMAQPGYYNAPYPVYNQGYPQPYYGYRGYGNRGYPPVNYGNRRYGNRGFGRSPFNRFGNRRWSRFGNGNNSWWGNDSDYGPDVDWFTNTPRRWMRQGPKDGAGQMFDDFLDAPSRMGDMPGGWSAPTISIPNPIDVADELESGSSEMFDDND